MPPILPRLLASLSFPQVIVADAEREHWKRKPAPAMDPAKDAIVFQQLDIDYVIAEPHPMLGPERKAMGAAAMLRIFGVTAGGNSVCVHVHGFEPYFYAKVPDSFQDGMCEGLRKNLNEPHGAAAARRPRRQQRVHQRRVRGARQGEPHVLPGG